LKEREPDTEIQRERGGEGELGSIDPKLTAVNVDGERNRQGEEEREKKKGRKRRGEKEGIPNRIFECYRSEAHGGSVRVYVFVLWDVCGMYVGHVCDMCVT